MKKSVILFLTVFFLLQTNTDAQMVVNDPAANLKLQQQSFLQNIMKGYQALSNRIQNSTLGEAVKTAKTVDKQLDLVETALDVADQFQQLQSVKDFFNQHKRMIQKIQEVNVDMASVNAFIRPTYRRVVMGNLEDAYVLCAKSISVISSSFIRRQLNLSDRMIFLKEAEGYLETAMGKIFECVQIVGEAKHYHQNIDKAKNFYKAIL